MTGRALERYTARGAGQFMKQEDLRLVKDRAILACRIWNDPSLGWVTARHHEPTNGGESKGESRSQIINDTTKEDVQNRNLKRALLAVSILVLLSLLSSRPQAAVPTTGVIPYNNSERISRTTYKG